MEDEGKTPHPHLLDNDSAIADIVKLTRLATKKHTVETSDYSREAPAFIVPNDHKVVLPDLRNIQPHAPFTRGDYSFTTLGSLIEYLEGYRTENLTVWVSEKGVIGIINDKADIVERDETEDGNYKRLDNWTTDGWRDHRAIYPLKHDAEWVVWTNRNNQLQQQSEFAEFLLDYTNNIIEPSGSEMVQLAHTFQVTSGAYFKQQIRTQSGDTSITYQPESDATAGKDGEITIPDTFKIALKPYEHSKTYEIEARFRYKMSSGSLAMGYKLHRLDLILETALEEVADKLSDYFDRVYFGTPPDENYDAGEPNLIVSE